MHRVVLLGMRLVLAAVSAAVFSWAPLAVLVVPSVLPNLASVQTGQLGLSLFSLT